MKTTIITFLLVTCIIFIKAQEQTVVYDFAQGKYSVYDIKPKRGKPISLKIININPFFYEINIKSEDKTISYQNIDVENAKKSLDELQQNNYYKMQESFAFAEENVSLLSTNNNVNSTKKIEPLNEKYLKRDKLELKLIDLEIKKQKLLKKNEDKDDNSLDIVIENNNDSILKTKYEIIKANNDINNFVHETKDQEVLKESINKRIEKLNKIYNQYINVARQIIKLNQNYNNFIDKVISPELNYNTYNQILENQKHSNSLQSNNNSLHKEVPSIESTFFLKKENLNYAYGVFKVYTEFYQSIISETNDFISFLNYSNINILDNSEFVKSILSKDIERIQKSINIADEVIQKINLSKKLNQIEILDRVFRDERTFEYVSAPIQGEEDYIVFDVAIKSKRNLTENYSINKDKSFKYSEYITGGIRFDFSIGTIFDFGTIDKKYTLDSNNIVKRLDSNKYNPTIAGIFHASFRKSGDFTFGFSLGTSFNTDFSFNSIFPGISLLIGKQSKFIFTVGPSFRLVNELKANYDQGMQLTGALSDEDLITKNFRIGGFVGISYNLTPKQKQTLKL